jgi:hypothetical protein
MAVVHPSCKYSSLVSKASMILVQEYVEGMQGAVLDLLKLWYNLNNKQLPDTIIMFRDGVSDGQYNAVMARELGAIQAVSTRYPHNLLILHCPVT